MTQKIAVAVVHGVGSQKADFAKTFTARLKKRFADEIVGLATEPEQELQVRGVYWANVLADKEAELQRRFASVRLDWDEARKIMIELGGDALAYQLNRQGRPADSPGTYEQIHMTFAGTLRALVKDAGEDAPLCVIAHSLGTIIASNYIWDLEKEQVPEPVASMNTGSVLESGRTLTSLYTAGSPLAVWSLRYSDFGEPVTFPPDLIDRYRGAPSEWVNFYDHDDVIGYPLKTLNSSYEKNVTEDLAVNVGHLATGWTPASHVGYWNDREVVARIAEGLARLWRAVNGA